MFIETQRETDKLRLKDANCYPKSTFQGKHSPFHLWDSEGEQLWKLGRLGYGH